METDDEENEEQQIEEIPNEGSSTEEFVEYYLPEIEMHLRVIKYVVIIALSISVALGLYVGIKYYNAQHEIEQSPFYQNRN